MNGSVVLTSSTANGLTFASAIAAVVPYSCDLIMDFEQLHSVNCRQASCIFSTIDGKADVLKLPSFVLEGLRYIR